MRAQRRESVHDYISKWKMENGVSRPERWEVNILSMNKVNECVFTNTANVGATTSWMSRASNKTWHMDWQDTPKREKRTSFFSFFFYICIQTHHRCWPWCWKQKMLLKPNRSLSTIFIQMLMRIDNNFHSNIYNFKWIMIKQIVSVCDIEQHQAVDPHLPQLRPQMLKTITRSSRSVIDHLFSLLGFVLCMY